MAEERIPKKLIRHCIKGNRKAQSKLYSTYSSLMFAVCLRYARTKQDAEDVFQEGFVKVFSSLDKFRYEGSFEGWMKRIFMYTAIQKYREAVKNMQVDDPEPHLQHITEEESTPQSQIKETVLMEVINLLPPRYKIVFNMYAMEGCSHAEIAEALTISVNTSKSNLSRARTILQKELLERGIKV